MSMTINRRQFMQLMSIASVTGMLPNSIFATKKRPSDMYEIPKFGNVSLLHITDTHAQLMPVYFREPNVNIGIAGAKGKAPHLVGNALLRHFGINTGSIAAHAFSYLDYHQAAQQYGKVGGFAHLASLVNRIRTERGEENCLLLDGGDTWQGSGTAYWTRGKDMVEACNLLKVDVMTGHWEFTYKEKEILDNIQQFKGDFIAQNIHVKEDALFDYQYTDFADFNEEDGRAFKPYVIKVVNSRRIAVVGQAFPYTPIANPKRFIPDWTFGINDQDMQELINHIRKEEKPDAVILLSHNGMDVDLKMASRVEGIDVIFGGHTHDGMPAPTIVKNAGGKTLVTNAGSNSKFLGVMDLDIQNGKVQDFRYRLLPIFSHLLPADPVMQGYIDKLRKPYQAKLTEELGIADELLYRRGNFNGTFDQVICNALREYSDAEVALSPGFRWGTSVLPGQSITMEHVLDQTCITYPESYLREMTGYNIKEILEDVCDNLFNPDPYYQQGGDMVRTGGIDYVCDPLQKRGKRISEMTFDNGTKVDMKKTYRVAGWATVNAPAAGQPVWEIVSDYIRRKGTIKLNKINTPKLKNIQGNPGIENYLL